MSARDEAFGMAAQNYRADLSVDEIEARKEAVIRAAIAWRESDKANFEDGVFWEREADLRNAVDALLATATASAASTESTAAAPADRLAE